MQLAMDPKQLALKVAWLAALGLTVLLASKLLGNVARRAS